MELDKGPSVERYVVSDGRRHIAVDYSLSYYGTSHASERIDITYGSGTREAWRPDGGGVVWEGSCGAISLRPGTVDAGVRAVEQLEALDDHIQQALTLLPKHVQQGIERFIANHS